MSRALVLVVCIFGAACGGSDEPTSSVGQRQQTKVESATVGEKQAQQADPADPTDNVVKNDKGGAVQTVNPATN
jgi:hypothetical protein